MNALYYLDGNQDIKMVHCNPENVNDPVQELEDYLSDSKSKNLVGLAIINLSIEGKIND